MQLNAKAGIGGRGTPRRIGASVLALVLAAAVTPGDAAAEDPTGDPGPVVVGESLDGVLVGRHIRVLEDRTRSLGIDDVASDAHRDDFVPPESDLPSYGFVGHAFWARFDVRNPDPVSRSWLLESGYSHVDHVDLYEPKAGGGFELHRTGDAYPFSQRDVEHRTFVFDLEAPPESTQTFYMRFESSGPMSFPLYAWTYFEFLEHQNREQPVLFFFFGLMTVMCLYNLFLYVMVKEWEYLYYGFYIAAYTLFQFTLCGYTFQYLTPDWMYLANRLSPIAMGLSVFFAAAFERKYLQFRELLPTIDKITIGSMWLVGALIAFSFVGAYATAIRLMVGTITVVLGFLSSVGAYLLIRRHRQARFFSLAWGLNLLGGMLQLLRALGLVPDVFIVQWGAHVGGAIGVVVLSVGLADRINVMRGAVSNLNDELSAKVDELKKALARAEEAARAKSNFLATVSHELRTPLNAIINIPQGLLRDFPKRMVAACGKCESVFDLDESDAIDPETECPDCHAKGSLAKQEAYVYAGKPEKTATYLGYVERSGQHLLQVVNGILDFSRLDAGREELAFRRVEVSALLREAVEPLGALAAQKKVDLVIDPLPDGAFLEADPLRIRQVVINLVGNAIKFSEEKGLVSVGIIDEVDTLLFYVRDQGIGIAPEHVDRIFQSFEQVHQGETRKYGGTGLGLTISRTLIELHKGSIWVESQVGKGSTFFFRLPKRQEKTAPAPRRPRAPTPRPGTIKPVLPDPPAAPSRTPAREPAS